MLKMSETCVWQTKFKFTQNDFINKPIFGVFVEILKDNLSYLSAQKHLARITKFRLKLMQLLWTFINSNVLFEFVRSFRSNPSSRGSRIDKMAIMTTESMAYFKTISFLENVDAKCRVFLIRHLDELAQSSLARSSPIFLLHAPKSQRLKLKN